MTRALALFSGGLDSLLAARLVMEQGIEVHAVQFITPFFGYGNKGRGEEAALEFREKYGFECIIRDVTEDYVRMLKAPRYGYGKNFNPCIDCKIFMMLRAKRMMDEEGYDFIVSGEVLGQRPMSQRRDALRIVERDSGLDGYLVRPLCANKLKPTIPEIKGLIDRDRLMDFSGRTRKPQMALAERFGITDYQTPAGGCLLTDPIISNRVRKLLEVTDTPTVNRILMLSTGRHFAVGGGATLYVGRNRKENQKIESLAEDGDLIVKVTERPGPLGLVKGEPGGEGVELAARIVSRYADAKDLDNVAVGVTIRGGGSETIHVEPGTPEFCDSYRVQYE